MGSVRLPGKTLLPLAGKPFLEQVLRRVSRVSKVDEVILVTSELPENDILVELASSLAIRVIRGDEMNLASRYLSAIERLAIDVIVRIPADNYLTEQWAVDMIIDEHLKYRNGFSTNIMQIMGSGFPDGIGAEVFEASEFISLHTKDCTPDTDEHVHKHFFDYSSELATQVPQSSVRTVKCPEKFAWPNLKFDINTIDDYRLATKIYEDLYVETSDFGLVEVLNWYKQSNLLDT